MPEHPPIIDADFTVVRGPRVQTPSSSAAGMASAVRPIIDAALKGSRADQIALARGAVSAIGLIGAGAVLAAMGSRARRRGRDKDQARPSQVVGMIGLAIFEHIRFEMRHRD